MPQAAHSLPALVGRRLDPAFEQRLYVARPGLAALPSGTLAILAVVGTQACSIAFLLWALWWPTPGTRGQLIFAVSGTVILVAIVAGIAWLLTRRYPGFALALIRAPLLEIERARVMGAILGAVDRKGRGNAAMVLVPGDPSADIDGNIHFDRLPNVAGFVAALQR